MAIGGVGGTIGTALPAGGARVQRPEETAQRRPAAPVPATTPAPAQPDATAEIPAEAPPGTDPALWSVLTAEERLYFTRLHALGPLTYGKRPAPPQAPVARGARIDRTV